MSTEKIRKPTGKNGETPEPEPFELEIAQALKDLEVSTDLKGPLRELYITGAREIEVQGKKNAIVISVPFPQLRQYQKIQTRLVRELEKKFSGQFVVIIGYRRILMKPTRKMHSKSKQKRPRSRTLTSVHEAILSDLVYPSEIVGKRIRVKMDGKRIIRVHLDKNQINNLENKLDTFVAVYKRLTGKDVTFEFPETL